MELTKRQSLHIANFLYIGVFKKKYPSVDISIGTGARVGINKRGSKYAVFTKYNDKYDRSSQVPMFDENISIEELAQRIQMSVSQSVMLEDIEVNLNVDPSFEIMNNNQDNEGNISPDNYTETFFEESDQDDYETDDDFDEITEEIFDTDNIENEVDSSDAEQSEEVFFDDIEQTNEDDEYIEETEEIVSEIADIEIPDQEENIFEDAVGLEYEEKNMESENKMDIAKNSYIYKSISDFDLKNKVDTVVQKIAEQTDKVTSVKTYIKLLALLLEVYDYDVEKVADESGIDKRDIYLALVEKNML